ncbi:MAG: formyltetrahydrofolate deformylase [Spirochaeta sp.]|jgi:formyltetrahydrofolate deformylase|uniref:formyltetrahydrofolate deformylase n=1 Tax=Sphaerochaeta sp. TaxID=1972642 RepID=UPI003D09C762|nr:formyltetrahydrofolate deformylase [Spirochaeta sp.]
MASKQKKIIFLIQCEDRKGILSATSTWFYQRSYNILHCQQHTDNTEGRYFMRIELDMADLKTTRTQLEEDFSLFAEEYNLSWECHYSDYRYRMAILVSKASHCLYDLIARKDEGDLQCDIPLIISNHPDLEIIANQFRIPFYYLPVTPETKVEQEMKVRTLLKRFDVDVVVLARYMQILSSDFIDEWQGKIINIHHGFLPAFQGANPYRRAYERGVKMIGATAHYASKDLDQGPIIEQDVVRVNHELGPAGLRDVGKDVERRVLAKGVQAHLESRIIIFKNRTIVFSSGQ